jgi:hypothetical protein
MEGDEEIFKAILEPLIVDIDTEGFKKQQLDGDDAADDVELEELPDPVMQPLNRYCNTSRKTVLNDLSTMTEIVHNDLNCHNDSFSVIF